MTMGHINRQGHSYRQGLVLGFTLAEVLLLLVFCLLLAVGASIATIRKDFDDANGGRMRVADELERTRDELAKAKERLKSQAELIDGMKNTLSLVDALKDATGGADPQKIDEFWRSLVESNSVVKAFEREGMRVSDLKSVAPEIAKILAASQRGLDINRLIEDAEFKRAVMSDLASKGKTPVDQQQLFQWALDGAAAQIVRTDDKREGHVWPPIINLTEADGYFFESGIAVLKPSFIANLHSEIVPRLLEIIRDYKVDIIEIVGHTDDQKMVPRTSNLDQDLPAILRGGAKIGALRPADNAGLGLSRALAVVTELVGDSRLTGLRILPFSAAQLVDREQHLTKGEGVGNVKERRRIEIRLRKFEP